MMDITEFHKFNATSFREMFDKNADINILLGDYRDR